MHAFDRQADSFLIAIPRLHFVQRGKYGLVPFGPYALR